MAREEFASCLNELLQAEERSACWLARRIGVAPSTVSRWLDGSTQPDSLIRVERVLDVLRISDPVAREPALQAYRYWWNYRSRAESSIA